MCDVAVLELFIDDTKLEEFKNKRVLEVGSKYVNGSVRPLARMLVPKFVCEVSRSSGFVWLVGGDGDLSRKECCKTRYSALLHSKREI
jgi:hypothetical protein